MTYGIRLQISKEIILLFLFLLVVITGCCPCLLNKASCDQPALLTILLVVDVEIELPDEVELATPIILQPLLLLRGIHQRRILEGGRRPAA